MLFMSNKYVDKKGYPRWKDSNGLVHRTVSKPSPGEVVHHIDGDKTNFRRENLENKSRSAHSKLHAEKRKESWW